MSAQTTDDSTLSGWWTDYETGKSYITMKEGTAVTFSTIVAVILSMALPRLHFFVKLAAVAMYQFITSKAQGDGRLVNANAQYHLLDPAEIELQEVEPAHLGRRLRPAAGATLSTSVYEPYDIIVKGTSAENTAALFAKDLAAIIFVGRKQPGEEATWVSRLNRVLAAARQNIKQHPDTVATSILLCAFFFTVFIGYQTVAVCAGYIIGSSVVRVADPQAGAWFPEILDPVHMSNTSIFTAVNDHHTTQTFRAVAYAENCYKNDTDSSLCGIFKTSQLRYEERRNAACPFQSDMCLLGPHSAYELDTGFLDSRALGINHEHTAQFRIRKICSPLADGDDFIKATAVGNTGNRRIEYHYGDGWGIMQQGNKTFAEVVPNPAGVAEGPADYLIREIRGDMLQILGSKSPRQWRAELLSPDARVTLYFIRPTNLVYTRRSDDPIFPATVPSQHMQYGDALYSTPHQRSTILACADSIQIRHPTSKAIWHPRYQNLSQLHLPSWKNPSVLSSLRIVNISYLATEYFDSRYSGASEHFDAPLRIRDFYSSPLSTDPPQWQLECRKMFNTKLASFQLWTLGIAQGLGHDLPRARDLLADDIVGEGSVHVKGVIIHPVNGMKNIKIAELVAFLLVAFGAWVSTIETEDTVSLIWAARSVAKFWREKCGTRALKGWRMLEMAVFQDPAKGITRGRGKGKQRAT
ncbi:hypothetical protein EJ04DRAFT_579138 [Polyplosphaeria fusca]|uniref:Uncharacterized protein n=1 Tax=Polyplosphaeria fusca TaxID=682080 RepID=A0A9P4QUZ4_9PLEO|nr:hypothetical protein EJ04DRAFT_579138 [Polyplosphaeria fusca]